MRNIKFRAWFHKDHWIAQENEQMIYDYTDKTFFELFGFWEKDIVYMQYTGLKDKNGKDIYEGDIVKIYGLETIEYDNAVVIYSDRWASFMIKAANDLSFYIQRLYSFEVIGNIHENPELL